MSNQPPTHMQLDVLRYIRDNGGKCREHEIPRQVAWYRRDVLGRMEKRGWVETVHSGYGSRAYRLTPAGRELAAM